MQKSIVTAYKYKKIYIKFYTKKHKIEIIT